ncbi:MAG: hypothetical protein WB562_04850 [Candidatus Sulfotelmatobacter sp.]
MRIGNNFFFPIAAISFSMVTCHAQDSPPLGDIARQQRQTQQAKVDPGKNARSAKVVTNDEIPEHAAPPVAPAARDEVNPSAASFRNREKRSDDENKSSPEHWKSQILKQKDQIASLLRQLDEINESIRYAPANCVANCVGWNERQREKQQRVGRMQAQLNEEKTRLDDMQEAARKQGYGSAVYDP